MKLSTVLAVNAAAAAAFVAARRLLSPETDLSRVPGAARAPLNAVRARLEAARERAKVVVADARQARREAEAELTADYHRRAGRSSS